MTAHCYGDANMADGTQGADAVGHAISTGLPLLNALSSSSLRTFSTLSSAGTSPPPPSSLPAVCLWKASSARCRPFPATTQSCWGDGSLGRCSLSIDDRVVAGRPTHGASWSFFLDGEQQVLAAKSVRFHLNRPHGATEPANVDGEKAAGELDSLLQRPTPASAHSPTRRHCRLSKVERAADCGELTLPTTTPATATPTASSLNLKGLDRSMSDLLPRSTVIDCRTKTHLSSAGIMSFDRPSLGINTAANKKEKESKQTKKSC